MPVRIAATISASARAVRRPGVAAAADQLEAAPVDPEQHRRARPLLAAQPDVELAAAPRAGQWPTEAKGRQPSAAGASAGSAIA